MPTTTIKISNKPLLEQRADVLAFFVEQNFVIAKDKDLKQIEKAYFPTLEPVMQRQGFTGKALSSCAVTGFNHGKVVELIFIGLGKKEGRDPIALETYRKAVGTLVRMTESRKGSSIALKLPKGQLFGVDDVELARQTSTIAQMAHYHFDQYITDKERKIREISDITCVTDGKDVKELQKGIDEGTILANAVNTCRYWIDTPAEHMTPEDMVRHAREIATSNKLKLTVFSEQEVCKMGMGGLCGVSKGSDRDCQFVILEYYGKKGGPTLGFVGKGITFDSGGLSIKPATNMENMKDDMSGAGAVLAAMMAIAEIKPKINVIGITPITENLISGKATKPGDVLKFYNGKTAEVKNTDAEGRLILADALSYAVKHYKLDALIDVATLTGACAYALGPHFTGLMSKHDELVDKLFAASHLAGDTLWRLPLPDEYKVAIKSSIADMSNIGSQRYMAGASTAALFLQNFVDDVPWVHLDIAGSSFDVPDVSYYRSDGGGTGAAVRLLVELAKNWK